MDNKCDKEGKIAEMTTVLTGLVKQVYGNGQPGIAFTIPAMQRQLEHLSASHEELRTAISGIMKYVNECEGVKEGRSQVKRDSFTTMQRTSIIITALVGTTTIIIARLKLGYGV